MGCGFVPQPLAPAVIKEAKKFTDQSIKPLINSCNGNRTKANRFFGGVTNGRRGGSLAWDQRARESWPGSARSPSGFLGVRRRGRRRGWRPWRRGARRSRTSPSLQEEPAEPQPPRQVEQFGSFGPEEPGPGARRAGREDEARFSLVPGHRPRARSAFIQPRAWPGNRTPDSRRSTLFRLLVTPVRSDPPWPPFSSW